MTAKPIRGTSVLPARREAIELHTADGLRLIGELSTPLERDPVATMICLHPLPTHGGMMDSHIFRKAAYRLPALADIAVLRFNSRGTASLQGRSEGQFGDGVSERFDVAAAVEYAEFHALPNPWLVGWSFGTDLTLMYGLEPEVRGAILLSPPLRYSTPDHLAAWSADGRPLLVMVPEFDDYLRPEEAKQRFASVAQAEVRPVSGGKHLWVGHAEVVLDAIAARLNPAAPTPLPSSWEGPMETADSRAYADWAARAQAETRSVDGD